MFIIRGTFLSCKFQQSSFLKDSQCFIFKSVDSTAAYRNGASLFKVVPMASEGRRILKFGVFSAVVNRFLSLLDKLSI